jgi:hypothetical protein
MHSDIPKTISAKPLILLIKTGFLKKGGMIFK